jgi:hypothetical protein
MMGIDGRSLMMPFIMSSPTWMLSLFEVVVPIISLLMLSKDLPRWSCIII